LASWLQAPLIVAKYDDASFRIYPRTFFQFMKARLVNNPIVPSHMIANLFEGCGETEMDDQGRIPIPESILACTHADNSLVKVEVTTPCFADPKDGQVTMITGTFHDQGFLHITCAREEAKEDVTGS
jgi:hypothetical protein